MNNEQEAAKLHDQVKQDTLKQIQPLLDWMSTQAGRFSLGSVTLPCGKTQEVVDTPRAVQAFLEEYPESATWSRDTIAQLFTLLVVVIADDQRFTLPF